MSASTDRLIWIIGALREHCAWTHALTHRDLMTYLVEECYELLEAVEDRHPDAELRGELGDVLLQVVLHAAIARERGAFDFDDVADTLSAKMIRRNTHVFTPEGTLRGSFPSSTAEIIASWDAAKAAEKAGGEAPSAVPAPTAGLPRNLPALMLAQKALSRIDRAADARLPAGLEPAAAARELGERSAAVLASEEALGDHLLAVAAAARGAGLDAEAALRGAVARALAGTPGNPAS
ncbi:MazG nucleotide pyrophosphohydrolase domain-containing protein [Paeniglutamicibacter cryotolerans]|uniref:XTP/dITP diphosphohydrolase n=1 Tax=Paeniglutamicibacter cryotolerans TaxID=670079 RepID=A0A839QJX5_9MICC|nr:MazG nucleotide pyrophosphohydrolase domain-containing protein [Paeniglutamicibacter cryotolerans]MBB2995893.1 XTP/dITP diphosphohydrolase [Paeniglutamicibacter cryotolerans]